MKYLLSKTAIVVALLFAAAAIGAADPAALQLLSMGRMNDVISALVNREDAESYNLLSRAYYATERWDDAVKNGERAVALRPGDSNFHLWLGREYGEKAADSNPLAAAGLARKAKTEFEHAVKLDPTNVAAHADLAEYYVEAPGIMGGGTDKARDQALQVQKYDPATAHWVLARVAEKEKRFDDAEREFHLAIDSAKNPAQYWLNLASFYRERERTDEVEKAVQKAIAQPNAPAETYYDSAEQLLRAGRNYPLAAEYLKKYLASDGLVEDAPAFRAHYLLGQVYEKMGNKSAATSEYRASLSLASGFKRARKALGES